MLRILNAENTTFDLDSVPDQIDDVRYCVLDNSDPSDADFYFPPLIFMESFHAPAICLRIGKYDLQLPMDWAIMISDEERTEMDVIPLVSLNNRGFEALVMNPLSGGLARTAEIEITNIYQDVKWFFPKLKNSHLLVVPLCDGENPPCVIIVKEINKVGEVNSASLIG
jgi:hypothetical protein